MPLARAVKLTASPTAAAVTPLAQPQPTARLSARHQAHAVIIVTIPVTPIFVQVPA